MIPISSKNDECLTRGNEWLPPVLFTQEPLLSIPKKILPGEIGEFAASLADATETPPELATLMVLGTLSCSVGGKVAIEAESGYIEPCHLYTCCALESGNRKTAVVGAATAPLSSWEQREADRLRPEIQRLTSERKTSEALIEKLRRTLDVDPGNGENARALVERINELEANLPQIPVVPKLWTSDSTPEKVECLLAEQNERFAVISDEGGIFDILGGRYSKGTNLDMFLKGHAGSPVRVHRTSREEVMLHRPALTLAVSPQPGVLRDLQGNAAFRNRGMLARILFAVPASNVGNRQLIPRPIPNAIREAYGRTITDLLNWQPQERVLLSLSGEAYRRWKEYQREVESEMRDGERLCTIRDWGSKLPGATLRIAGLLHVATRANLSNLSTEVSASIMDVALALGRILTSHALAVFQLISEDDETRNAKRILSWLVRQDSRQVPKRACFRAHQHIFGKVEQFNLALRTLESRNMIRISKWDTDTKSGELIELNPALWTQTTSV